MRITFKIFLLLIIQLHFFYKLELASFRHTSSIVSNSVNCIYENSLPRKEYSDKDISHSDTPAHVHSTTVAYLVLQNLMMNTNPLKYASWF